MEKKMENEMETGGRGLWGLGFPKFRGTFLGGPHNKDYSILVLGSPYFGKLPCRPTVKGSTVSLGNLHIRPLRPDTMSASEHPSLRKGGAGGI